MSVLEVHLQYNALKICLKVLVTIQLTMYMRFLYVTEFLAESNEGNFFYSKADTVVLASKRKGLEELSTEILGMEGSVLA